MRIALFSDIHGNSIALDAVLQDIQKQGGVDAYWILGDLVAIEPDPVSVLERLTSLENTRFVQGNGDRYTVTGERPSPSIEDVRKDFETITVYRSVNESFAWTQGAVTVSGYLEFLSQLSLHLETVLEDGTKLLGVHASFEKDDGVGVKPDTSEDDLRKLFKGCNSDLVCVGHTHRPNDRQLDDLRIVNIGSLSNPMTKDLRASYTLLDVNSTGHNLKHYKVDYDYHAFLAQCEKANHPATEFIKSHFVK